MNNDDFRALLVKKSAGRWTTKEIAREVVENEFSMKKRGGGGGGSRRSRRQRSSSSNDDDVEDSDGGSSSDDNATKNQSEKNKESEEQVQQQPEWKRRRKEKKLQAATSAGIAPLAEYRDRAKERREGTNADYALLDVGSGQLSSSTAMDRRDMKNHSDDEDDDDNRKRQVELSQYLGGDEEHTHLVKGLDKALAEKVRREEMTTRMQPQQQSIGLDDTLDLDEMLEDANNTTTQKEQQKSDWRSTKQTRTELGSSMLNYLFQKEQRGISSSTSSKAAAAAAAEAAMTSAVPIQHGNPSSSTLLVQRSIQQTIYNFLQTSNVHQRHDAWEVPSISILPTTTMTTTTSTAGTTTTSGRGDMSPLSKDIIMAIIKKLDSRASSSSLTNNEKRNNPSASHDVNRKGKTTMTKKNGEVETAAVLNRSYNDNITHDGESVGNNNTNDDSDDDSDIFDNVGNNIEY
jgi:IK cytokine